MQYDMLYANYNTKTQQTPRAKWSERPKRKPSETKTKSQKPWAISQVKPKPKAKSQKPKAKSQKPKAKSQVGTQMEILAPKCMQSIDFSSKMQQIARKAAPGWKTKEKLK